MRTLSTNASVYAVIACADSAGTEVPLFAALIGTLAESDCFNPFIIDSDALLSSAGRCCMNTLWGWGRASWAGCGPDVRRGGQTLIMGYSADKSPLIGHLAGPLRRLEPLVAQRQEKCGPNRPTPTGYSCNNAAHDRLRDAAYHWARVAAQRDPASRAKYQALRSRGHGHARSLRSVADRLLNIACAMLRDGVCFNPHRAGTATA